MRKLFYRHSLILLLPILTLSGLLIARLFGSGDHVEYPDLAMDVTIPVNNITAEYRFDECDWTGEDGEVRDEKLEHFGTISGSPVTFQGRLCKAADFRGGFGDNYYVKVQNVLSEVTEFSFTFWIHLDNQNTNEIFSGSKFADTLAANFYFAVEPDKVITRLHANQSGTTEWTQSSMFLENNWHHIAFTRSGLTEKLFVDGEEMTSVSGSLEYNFPITIDTLRIGSADSGSNYDFDGLLDELKIFNVALTENEIEQIYIYESDPPLRNSDGSLRACGNCNVYGDWYFDDCYYPSTDGSVEDASGAGSTAIIRGAPVSAPGQVCRSVMLNGIDYFEVPNPYLDNLSQEITLTAWIYPFSKVGSDRYIISKGGKYYGPGQTDAGFQLYLTADNRICWRLNGENNSGNYIYSSAGLVQDQEWTHVAATFKNETDKMYLYTNGALVDSAVYTGIIGPNDFTMYIGRDSTNTNNGFYGRMDEVKIYNEAYTQDQIETIYLYQLSGKSSTGLERACYDCVPQASLYYPFDDCGTYAAGNDVQDASGHGNSGTATGNPFNAEGYTCQAVVPIGRSYFQIPDNDGLDSDGYLSLMAWLYVEANDSSTSRDMTVFSKYRTGTGYQMGLSQAPGDDAVVFWDTDGDRQTSVSMIPIETWTHILVTFDGQYKRIFINGELDKISLYSGNPIDVTSYDLYVGAENNGSSRVDLYYGKIDELALFQDPVSESQIEKMYGYMTSGKDYTGAPSICTECPPLGYWTFDECSYNESNGEVKDSGPNGFDGTTSNYSSSAMSSADAVIGRSAYFEPYTSWYSSYADYIEVPYNDLFNMVYDQIGIAMWVKVEEGGGWLVSLNKEFLDCDIADSNPDLTPFSHIAYEVAMNGDYYNDDWVWQTTDDEWDPYADCAAASSNPNLPTWPVTFNEWHFMVFTSDAHYKKIFMDGELKAVKEFGSPIYQVDSNVDLYIGTTGGAVGYGGYAGWIDELAIYNFPLTDEKIQEMYQNSLDGKNYDGTDRDIAFCGNVAEWRFDECGWDNRSEEAVNSITKNSSRSAYGTGYGTRSLDIADDPDNAILTRSLEFESGDYLRVADFDTLNGLDDFTFSFWIKPTEANSNVIFSADLNGSEDRLVMVLRDNNTIRTYYTDETTEQKDFDFDYNALSLNEWHHVVWRRYYKRQRIGRTTYYAHHDMWVDGSASSDNTLHDRSHPNVDITDLYIGTANHTSYVNDFEGVIDEVTVFSSALDEASIVGMYNNYLAGKNFAGSARTYRGCSPASYWKFDECHWYSPPTKQAGNEITLALNATAKNSATTMSAQVCNGARFDGVDDWLFTDKTEILSGRESMSLDYFVRFDSLGSNPSQAIIIMGDTTDALLSPTFMMDYLDDELRAYVYTDDQNYYNANFRWDPNPGEWYNIAMTFYKNRPEPIEIYLDGVKKSAPNRMTGTFTELREKSSRIFMGKYRPASPRWLNGGLDEVRIFDYALTQASIDTLNLAVHTCEEDCGNVELLVYYKFDECNYIGQYGEVKDNANVINLHASLGENANCYVDTGKVCRQAVFDGDNDFMITEPDNFLAGRDEVTVTFWMYLDRYDVDSHIIKQFDYDNDVYDVFEIFYQAADSSINFYVYRDVTYIKKYAYQGWKPKIGNWYHVAAVYDAAETNLLSLFINGQRVAGENVNDNNDIPSLPNFSEPLVIGRDRSDVIGEDNNFWGALDEIRIYGTALTDNQILDVYNDVLGDCAICGAAGLPPKTAEWMFNSCTWDGTEGEVHDNTINYLHGRAVNVDPQLEISCNCRSAEFPGSGYITVPYDTLFDFSRSVSISLWVYLNPQSTTRTLISKNYPDYTGFRLAVDANDQIVWQINSQDWNTGIFLEEETWNHVVVTYNLDPVNRYLYVNGTYKAYNTPSSQTIGINTNPVILGALQTGSSSYGEYLDGYLDDVTLFTFPLVQDHVEDIYKDTLQSCFACAGDVVSSSTDLPENVWRLIGVPTLTSDGDPMAVIGDDLDGKVPNDTTLTWNMIAYSTSDSSYSYYSSSSAVFPDMVPGRGFIIAQHLDENIRLSYEGEAVITPFGYTLNSPESGYTAGMNLCANPFESMIRWSNVRVAQGTDTCSIAEAAAAPRNWLNSYAYVWDYRNNEYSPVDPVIDSWYDRDTLSSWEGYWVVTYSSVATKLIYDREDFGKKSSEAMPKISPTGDSIGDYSRFETMGLSNDWVGMLALTAQDGSYRSRNFRFGVDKWSSDGADGRDAIYFEPNADRFISMYFNEGSQKLQYDLRSSSGINRLWDLVLDNTGTGVNSWYLQLMNRHSLPGNIRVALISREGAILSTDLAENTAVPLTAASDSRQYLSLSVSAVPDSTVDPSTFTLMPVPLSTRSFDFYFFPGELMEDVRVGINGTFYSAELADKLYNVYRKRIDMRLTDVEEVITVAFDLSGNARADTSLMSFVSVPKGLTASLKSDDGRVTLELGTLEAPAVVGLGQSGSALTEKEKTGHLYTIQPYGQEFPDGTRIEFDANLFSDLGADMNDLKIVRLTETDWEGLETRYDMENGKVYAEVSSPGIYDIRQAEGSHSLLPDRTTLSPNFPNPFNAVTTVNFSLADAGPVRLHVYNILGERIAVLTEGFHEAGLYSARWNGANESGIPVSSGVYFIRLQSGTTVLTQKVLLLK